MPVCLSFAGVAGCIAFQVGSAKELVRLLAEEGEVVTAYAGLSSGSVVATLLALGYSPDELEKHFVRFTALFHRWHHYPVTHWFDHLRVLWKEIMPSNAYNLLSDRLYIGYSAVTCKGLEPRIISRYYSNEDVMRAIEVSCHIMPYRFLPVQWYRDEWCCDGAFSTRLLRPKGYRVIGLTPPMVHAHVFWSDWFPTLELYKMQRLQDAGQCFVQRHRNYFQSLVRGEKAVTPILPTYFNPFRWIRRIAYLYVLYVLWFRCRRWLLMLAKWRYN